MTTNSHLNVVYKEADDVRIDIDVYLPSISLEKCPVVINIHGGAFMLGASEMVNKDQVSDCTQRGWIVVVPNHRLCPQVNLLEGPIRDCRDLLEWVYNGELEKAIQSEANQHKVDLDNVFAFGTSSGGHLSLCLGFGVSRPVKAILDFYGPCDFTDSFWKTSIPQISAILPQDLGTDFLDQVFNEKPIPIRGGVSLEGQAGPAGPNFSDPRQAFAFTQIANGKVLDAIFPSAEWNLVDPIRNIDSSFPPTCIVHGQADTMVPIHLSRSLFKELKKHEVYCRMIEVPSEEHTFAAKMKVGSSTWDLQRQGFDFLEGMIQKAIKQ